jgi:hypothetical protein
MKASDIIRELLCLIDVIDRQQAQSIVPQPVMPEPIAAVSVEIPLTPELDHGPRRFKQIFDILSAQRDQQYANSPAEVIAGIESVTTDAGLEGVHPADLRVKDPNMYPNYQGQ